MVMMPNEGDYLREAFVAFVFFLGGAMRIFYERKGKRLRFMN